MSKFCARTGLLLLLLSTAALADSPQRGNAERVLSIGNSGWEVYRPLHRSYTVFDFEYATYDLRSDHSRLGIRFKTSSTVTLDLRIDPVTRSGTMVGPVYDMDIGATTLSLGFRF